MSETILGRIYWRLYMWKLKLILASSERKTKHLRRRYCRYGIHKIRNESLSIWDLKTRKQTVRYLHCQYCHYKFFASQSQKDKYEKISGNYIFNRKTEIYKNS